MLAFRKFCLLECWKFILKKGCYGIIKDEGYRCIGRGVDERDWQNIVGSAYNWKRLK